MQVLDGDRRYELRGRVAGIVRWLAENEGRLTQPRRVQVTFDCAGSSVSAEVKQREQVDAAFLR